jgi:uncharacterized protein YegJ (DUF2314 family)
MTRTRAIMSASQPSGRKWRIFDVALLIFMVFAFLTGSMTGCSRSNTGDKAIGVSGNDAEMNAAIQTARGKLPEFWKVFDQPENGESVFALKVKIEDEHFAEHFWVVSLRRQHDKVFGTINNDPETVKSVKLGQEIEVPEANISDWMFMRNGKMFGNYTFRVLFKQMPEAQVEKYKAIMADL